MKISKISAVVAAAAVAVSMAAVSASATNWANASYADDDPNTVKIISTDENKVSFTSTADGTTCKARITVSELLEAGDIEKVKSASWTVTYDIPEGTAGGNGVGGGTYFGCKNSTGYWISPDEYDDDGVGHWGTGTYTAADDVKFLLPTEVLTADSELVFMDWSNHEAITAMTVSISDLKFFDADGNELAQKAYAGAASSAADTATPAADSSTTSTATGNVPAAAVAGVMAVAGAAAVATKKRK